MTVYFTESTDKIEGQGTTYYYTPNKSIKKNFSSLCTDRQKNNKESIPFFLTEINKDRDEADFVKDPESITLEHLNAYSSELLRCRHVMLFYRGRLKLYQVGFCVLPRRV